MRKSKLLIGGLSAAVLLAGGVFWWKSRDPGLQTPAQPLAPPVVQVAPLSPDGIALASPHAAAVRVPSAPGAWGGPRKGDEATLSDRVVDYTIQVTLDPDKHQLNGQQKLVWRNRSELPVKAVYLHLYLNAFEGEGSTFMTERSRLGFGFRSEVETDEGDWGHTQLTQVSQGGMAVPWYFVHPDGGPVTDHTVVRLDLPEAVAPGANTTLDINFNSQLPKVVARTGYVGSFHLVGQWFPKIGVLELPGERGATAPRWNVHEFHLHSEFYADYGHYDVNIKVPDGYTVGATGEAQGLPVSHDGWTSQRFVQGDVHDFAWTADKRTAKPLTATWTGAGSPNVTVTVLYPPEYEQNAQPVLQATLDSLTYFSQTLGAYPYKTVTAVIPPYNAEEAGGMEYPTFFTASSFARSDKDTATGYALDFVTIHEFGHGYFYGLLGSNEFEEPMLDEGLNEYWDLRMIRDRGQKIHLTSRLLRRLGWDPAVGAFEMERLPSVMGEAWDELGENSWDRLSSNSYGSVYGRTATAMRDLEAQLGRPVLEKAFKAYYRDWKYRHPSIADFQASLVQASGQPALVNAIFEAHVYRASKVDDRIERLVSKEELPLLAGTAQGPKGWVELTPDQVDGQLAPQRKAWKAAHPDAKTGIGPFPWRTTLELRRQGIAVPQTVLLHFADGSQETLPWHDEGRWKRFSIVRPSQVVSAELDPDALNRMDQRLLDNSNTLKADRRASTRWGLNIASLTHTLFALVAAL